jgi:uncharacterized membrane protein
MTGYNLLLFVHVLSAMTWLGGGLILLVAALRLRQSATDVQTFAKVLPYVGIRLFMPAVILVLVTGVWMVLADSEWSFRQAWVLIALVLFAVAFAVGGVYLSRVGIAMDRAAGDATAQLPVLVNRWLAGYAVVLVVLLLVVADMVFKPGTS